MITKIKILVDGFNRRKEMTGKEAVNLKIKPVEFDQSEQQRKQF
jgi:hypothetical protein